LGKLPFGKGLLDSAIVSQVQCKQSVFHSYPATNETLNVCGAYVHTSVKVLSPPCDAHIAIEDSCAVSSSTAFDDQHLPSNVLTNDASVWSPAIRSGSKWNNNIVFDFQEIVAPNSVTILAPASGYNIPSKVSIYSSFSVSDSSYTKIENSVAVPADGKIQLSIRTHARFMKIMIEESSGGYEKIGISYVEWRGCPKSSTSPLSCGPDTTRLSTDPTKYRHFAVDPAKQILYFCDVNPYRVGIFCYSVKKETLTFVELPHYIRYIQGYSTVKGRMYFKGKGGMDLSSRDGKHMEIMEDGEISAVTDIAAAEVVAGGPTSMPSVTSEGYTADFYGITQGGAKIVQWSSCCAP